VRQIVRVLLAMCFRVFTDYGYRANLRRNYLRQAIPVTSSENAESLWPTGVFLPPVNVNDLGYSWYETQRNHPNIYKSQGEKFFYRQSLIILNDLRNVPVHPLYYLPYPFTFRLLFAICERDVILMLSLRENRETIGIAILLRLMLHHFSMCSIFVTIAEGDPYLLTGYEAMMTVKYLYGLGELFFDDYPHTMALLRNQEERLLSGLHGHVLSSLNPTSPFYRKGVRGN